MEEWKTKTRRIINCPKTFKGQEVAGFHIYRRASDGFISEICMYDEDERDFEGGQILPKYKIGEIVAVAQSYEDISNIISKTPSKERSEFYCKIMKSCYPKDEVARDKHEIAGWNNKMFVKPGLMVNFIRMTDLFAQRLQDISDEDCLAEGIIRVPPCCGPKRYGFYDKSIKTKSKKLGVDYVWYRDFNTPREAYSVLIDKMIGKGTWKSNSYVWAYDFERVK